MNSLTPPVGPFREVHADPVTINGVTFTDDRVSAIWVLADELRRVLSVHPSPCDAR